MRSRQTTIAFFTRQIGQLFLNNVCAQIDALITNEYRRTRDEFFNFVLTLAAKRAIKELISRGRGFRIAQLGALINNFINEAVITGLICRHEIVAIGIFSNGFNRLTGAISQNLIKSFA